MDWSWLQNVYWGNRIIDYGYFVGLIALAYLLRFVVASLIAAVVLRIVRLLSSNNLTITALLLHLRKPFEALVLFGILYIALLQLKMPPEFGNEAAHKILEIGRAIFKFVLVGLLLWLTIRAIRLTAEYYKNLEIRNGGAELPDLQLVQLTATLAKAFVSLFVILLYLNWGLGLNVGSILTGFGIGGIAIALAAKETIENLLGSLTIFLDKPFKIGDYVKVGDFEGVIEYVGIRSTRVRTIDGTLLSVPNKKVVDSSVENFQLRTHRFIQQGIGIKYETPLDTLQLAISEINEFLADNPSIKPEIAVRLFDFEESCLKIKVVYTVIENNGSFFSYLKVREEINLRIFEILTKHNISFAYPTRTIYTLPASSADDIS